MMVVSLLVIGLVVLSNWVFIESHLIQVEPNGTIFVTVGERFNILCYSESGSYDRLEWSELNGTIFTPNVTRRIYTFSYSSWKYDHSILVFNPVSFVDSSPYLCHGISNSSISNYTEVFVKVTGGYPPSFDVEFESYEFVVGEDIYLECYADGTPELEYIWLDNRGREMHDNYGKWNVSTKGGLNIYSISTTEEGTYTCVASNSLGNASKQYIVSVSRGYPPSFDVEFEYYEFVLREDIYLECHADGTPEIEYIWLDIHGREMHNDIYNKKWNVSTEGGLNIYSISHREKGTYTCVASNSHGNASKQYIVRVSSAYRPDIYGRNEQQEFRIGDNVVLKAEAAGYPTPEFDWFDTFGRNMRYIFGNWNASGKGVLEIYSIRQEQFGNYTCVASNAYGNDSKMYELEILHMPKLNVTVREKWRTLVRFTIRFKNDAYKFPYVIAGFLAQGSNDTWRKVMWNLDDEYIITGLEPGTTYDFKFGVKKLSDGKDLWIKDTNMSLTFPPFSPLLIVKRVKEDSIEIEFQSLEESKGSFMPLYYMLRYVKLRQKSGSFYEDDCPINIRIPVCSGRGYVIGGLSSKDYYKIQLNYMLKSGSNDKSEIIVRTY